jgi:O-antigen/teichoic acid export membrane protein
MSGPSFSIASDLRKLATGTALAFSSIVLGNVLVYLYGLMIARFLGAESVGLFFLALAVVQCVSAVCRAGLPEGLLRFVAIYSGNGDLARIKGTVFLAIAVAGVEP